MKFFTIPRIVYLMGIGLVSIGCLVAGAVLGAEKVPRSNGTLVDNIKDYENGNLTDDQNFISDSVWEKGILRVKDLYWTEDDIFDEELQELNDIHSRSKRDITINVDNNASSQIASLARLATTDIISLVKDMKSFNATAGISAEKKNKFMTGAVELAAKMSRKNVPTGGIQTMGIAANPGVKSLRHYQPGEIGLLEAVRDSIADTKAEAVQFVYKVNEKIPKMNGTNYDCTDLISYWGNNSGGYNSISGINDIKANPDNIFVFMCTTKMKINSMDDLIECIDAEIDKGDEVASEVDFYITIFHTMNTILRTARTLDLIVIMYGSFDYGHPLTTNIEN